MTFTPKCVIFLNAIGLRPEVFTHITNRKLTIFFIRKKLLNRPIKEISHCLDLLR